MTRYNLHRQILSEGDLNDFLTSSAFIKIESFLLALNESVKGRERLDTPETAAGVTPLISWLKKVLRLAEDLIEAHPPQNRNADVNRFGNVAFRDWLFALQDSLLPGLFEEAVRDGIITSAEGHKSASLEGYFVNSLGSSQRIDYGTGHELHFLVFLMGLEARVEEYPDLVLEVFSGYLKLMRRLQKTYWLEPAGSHGVWGLDDYHFLPFLFGSAQLCGQEHIRPRAVHSAEMAHYLAPKYIYFDSILNILEIKSRASSAERGEDYSSLLNKPSNSLRWMSPLLDDISAVKSWEKVNSGLIKMWRVEVMSKLPIMQHLLFDESMIILPFKRNNQKTAENDQANTNPNFAHHYTHSQRGDCCGNPLPSIYSSLESKKQPGLPFD